LEVRILKSLRVVLAESLNHFHSSFQVLSNNCCSVVIFTIPFKMSKDFRQFLLIFIFCCLTISVLYHVHPCMIFLKRYLVFPLLLLSSISSHCSFRKAFLTRPIILCWVYRSLSPLPFASLLSSAIHKAYSDNHFAFLHFFFGGMVLVTASCTVL